MDGSLAEQQVGYDESDSGGDDEQPPTPKRARAAAVADDNDLAADDAENANDPLRAYEMLKRRWLRPCLPHELYLDEFEINMLDIEQVYDKMHIRDVYAKRMREVIETELALFRERFLVAGVNYRDLERSIDTADEISSDFDTMRRHIESCRQVLEQMCVSREIANGRRTDQIDRSVKDLGRTYTMKTGNQSDVAKLSIYFLELAYSRGLRKEVRSKDVVLYEPRIIDGHTTVSFRQCGKLSEWFHRSISPDIAPDLFAILYKKSGTAASVLKYLEDTFDSRLPHYVVSDHIHGFDNCFVNVYDCTVHFYEDNPPDMHRHVARHHHEGESMERWWFEAPTPRQQDGFWVYDHDLYEVTPPNGRPTRMQLRYPIIPGVPPPPLHIPMSAVYQILDFQEYTPEMIRFFLGMIGRTMLPVNTKDMFATILLMSGVTHSGKSTFIDLIADALFPNRDLVAVLGSNKEEVFGLGKSSSMDVLICDEMEKRPRWNLGEIKSMATGGWMSINVKHGDPIFMHWRAPVVISSNFKVPDWGGGANDVYAVIRRFAAFPFTKSVAVPDDGLRQALKQQHSAFFASTMLVYHDILNNVGTSAFSRIAPPECIKLLREMLIELHPLVAYLETSKEVEFVPDDADEDERRGYYVTMDDLSEHFTAWTKKLHIKNDNQWKPEFYKTPLAEHRCVVSDTKENREYPFGSGMFIRGTYVDGMRIVT